MSVLYTGIQPTTFLLQIPQHQAAHNKFITLHVSSLISVHQCTHYGHNGFRSRPPGCPASCHFWKIRLRQSFWPDLSTGVRHIHYSQL